MFCRIVAVVKQDIIGARTLIFGRNRPFTLGVRLRAISRFAAARSIRGLGRDRGPPSLPLDSSPRNRPPPHLYDDSRACYKHGRRKLTRNNPFSAIVPSQRRNNCALLIRPSVLINYIIIVIVIVVVIIITTGKVHIQTNANRAIRYYC